jgi:endonuclease-3
MSTRRIGNLTQRRGRAKIVFSRLTSRFPNVGTFLDHRNAFELLIAVILSAQCTDARVNMVTPGLFEQFSTPAELANAPIAQIESAIKSINFFRSKSQRIKETAKILCDRYHSEVPDQLDDLIQLPGVGRKTANVVLGQVFGQPGITADTHVKRVSKRLGFTLHTDPVKVEFALMKVWDQSTWTDFSSILILHGRETCHARRPICESCILSDICPQAM